MALVGIRNAAVDVVVNIVDRLYRRERPARYKRRRTPVPESPKDWLQVLDLGPDIDPALVEPPRVAAQVSSAGSEAQIDDLARSLAILLGSETGAGLREVRLQRQDGEVVISISDTADSGKPQRLATVGRG